MGLAYTVDTPVKVARFGINSVVSIIQDNLLERMRCYYYRLLGESYVPITPQEPDYRARRITDYLNLLQRMVNQQVERLKTADFEPGSDLTKYFEMLPEGDEAKVMYRAMRSEGDSHQRLSLQQHLREIIRPGSIDVNIMTKVDKVNLDHDGKPLEDGSDAVAALRGYVQSELRNSSMILSAGMNPRLFAYMEKQTAWDPDADGHFDKKIVIKVSDYRSALIQGKMLAKRGMWVSEFRIESGLNCGGHAFATDGYLLGPILEEFKMKKSELTDALLTACNEARIAKGKAGFEQPPAIRITVQGGIGTRDEDELLRTHYGVDGTGWGTPFLLVPEATTVDPQTLDLLSRAKEEDVILSRFSPLGVRFHYLKGTSADQQKQLRIRQGMPGSPCTEKFLVTNTEFGPEPICTASYKYQKLKLSQLESLHLPDEEYQRQKQAVVEKECLCVGLSNAVVSMYPVKEFNSHEGINICPGPNIAYFSEIVSLQKMVDHIYGRTNIIRRHDRPHMFIKELTIYVDYWKELVAETKAAADQKRKTYVAAFQRNLLEGIAYYRALGDKVQSDMGLLRATIEEGLAAAEAVLLKPQELQEH
jgi:hypothetical protein